MITTNNADDFFNSDLHFKKELQTLRKLLLKSGLTETIKWGIPVYCYGKDNLVGCCEFKNHFGLWFYQGALLADFEKKLMNANEGTTKAMRQWRMNSLTDIDETLILQYIYESIENFKNGKKITATKHKPLLIPDELHQLLIHHPQLNSNFESFNLTRKREFCEYIESARRLETKLARLQKITALIQQGIGLNDKYRTS